jgi:eukaryotic-like serine/threonine-protein kinase
MAPLNIPGLEEITEVGRGAFATVFRARRRDRAVAVKVLRPEPKDARFSDASQRFRREADVLGRIRHPTLLQLLEVGEVDGRPYLVMDFAEGETLAAHLAGGALEEGAVTQLARSLAGVLMEIHRSGFIHRDVKPSNIMWGVDGKTHLVDFGFAVSIAEISATSSSVEIAGTVHYAAPEQLRMIARTVDTRADLYALGTVLFECATGRPPFAASSAAEIAQMHATVAAPEVRSQRPQFHPALSAIIGKLLCKDPDDRYQSAESLLADLNDLPTLERELRSAGHVRLGRNHATVCRSAELRLVGRKHELDALLKTWRAAESGKGGVVLVTGEGGSGKTRLIRELIRAAAEGGTIVLTGKCQQSAVSPFGPLREAIDDYIGRILRMEGSTRLEWLARTVAAAADTAPVLRTLSGAFRRLIPDEIGRDASIVVGQEQFYQALADFIAALAKDKRVLLFLDDVQWIDEASLRVLSKVAAHAQKSALLVAGTSRDDAASLATLGRVREHVRGFLLDEIGLGALDEACVADLVAQHLGGHHLLDVDVQRLTARAGGNPFAIGQYVRAFVDSGALRSDGTGWRLDPDGLSRLKLPDNVIDLVIARVSKLTARTAFLLSRAAALGTKFSLTLLCEVAGEDPASMHMIASEALGANLIEQQDDDVYAFVHDRVREALLRSLTSAEQTALHDTIAETLDRRTPDAPQDIYALAGHYSQGHVEFRPYRLFQTNLAAAQLALRSHAYSEATEFLDHARAGCEKLPNPLPPEEVVPMEEALGLAAFGTGRATAAVNHFRRVLELSDAREDRVRIHVHLIRVHMSRWDAEETWQECRRALEILGEPWSQFAFGQVLASLFYSFVVGILLFFKIDYGKAKGADVQRRGLLASVYAFAAFGVGEVGMRPHLKKQLLPRVQFNTHLLGSRVEAVEPLHFYALAAAPVGRRSSVVEAAQRAIAIAERTADPNLIAMCQKSYQWALHMLGDTREAEAAGYRCLNTFGHSLLVRDFLACVNDLAQNLQLRGHMREALAVQRKGLERALETDPRILASGNANIRAAMAHSLAVLGEFGEAAKLFRESAEIRESLPKDRWVQSWTAWHAVAFYLEQDEYGDRLDDAFRQFDRLHLEPKEVSFHCRAFYVSAAYARDAGYRHASQPEKEICFFAWERAVRNLELTGNAPHYRCHALIARAALEAEKKHYRRATTRLATAERLVSTWDIPWGEYEIARVRARIARTRGDQDEALRQARRAWSVADAHGWKNRASRVEREHGVAVRDDERRAHSHSTPAALVVSGASLVTQQLRERYLTALLDVSAASTSTLDSREQARAALDALIRVLGADRAYLFLVDPESDAVELHAARDQKGADLPEAKGYSTTVVEQVRTSRVPVIVTGTDDGAIVESDSMVANDLRSVIAAPLVARDKLLGVVYLDNRLVKGLFGQDDIPFLGAMANHIALALETSRAAQIEVERRAMEKELDLAKSIQGIIEYAADAIVTLNETGSIEIYNPAAAAMFGYATAEALGMPFDSLLSGSFALNPAKATIEAHESDGRKSIGHSGEITGRRKDGSAFPMEFTLSEVHLKDKRLFTAIVHDISERRRAQQELAELHRRLVEASRQAGKAEVASDVLHNVGNILTSVSVSATVVAETVSQRRFESVRKVANLFQEHEGDLGAFLTEDERGKLLPTYLDKLSQTMAEEHHGMLSELSSLTHDIEHISKIISLQQSYARVAVDVGESVSLPTLVDDALRISGVGTSTHDLAVIRDYADDLDAVIDRHKTLQILVNLIRNAKHSIFAKPSRSGRMTLRIRSEGDDKIRVDVEDDGIGIPEGNILKIFRYGFTTKADGHGFGLHGGALAAKQMGGALSASSEGVGRGAIFSLILPRSPQTPESRRDRNGTPERIEAVQQKVEAP